MWVHSLVTTVTCHSSDAHLQLFFQRCSASTEVIQKQMTLREEVELQLGRGKKNEFTCSFLQNVALTFEVASAFEEVWSEKRTNGVQGK